MIALELLGEAESREMTLNLLDRLSLSPAVCARITRAVDGNPLFTEELVAMLVDEEPLRAMRRAGSQRADLSELPVPSTINALLAAWTRRVCCLSSAHDPDRRSSRGRSLPSERRQ